MSNADIKLALQQVQQDIQSKLGDTKQVLDGLYESAAEVGRLQNLIEICGTQPVVPPGVKEGEVLWDQDFSPSAGTPLTPDDWKLLLGSRHKYFTGDTSLTKIINGRLVVSHPADKVADLNTGVDLPDTNYRQFDMTVSVKLADNFTVGSDQYTGVKLGGGLSGGTYLRNGVAQPVSGGSVSRNGWSAKMGILGEFFIVYMYYSNRPGMENNPDVLYGHAIPTSIRWEAGKEYELTLRVILNDRDTANGQVIVLEGDDVVLTKVDILFNDGAVACDNASIQSNHGGSDERWAPQETTHIEYWDVCVTGSNPFLVVQPPVTPVIERGQLLMNLPSIEVSRGNLTRAMLKQWNGAGTHVWDREMRDWAMFQFDGMPWLRAYHEPQSYGTRRCTIAHVLPTGQAYRISSLVRLSDNWEFGGPIKPSNILSGQSGKLGVGLGSAGNLTSGGDIDPEGFTCRSQWRGRSHKAYCYDKFRSLVLAGKPDGSAYGDERPNPSYPVTMSDAPAVPGQVHEVILEVHMNTRWDLADGKLLMWVDAKQIIDDHDIAWMGTLSVAPNIARSLLTSFHGGSSTAWAPSQLCWADYGDIRVLRLR